MVLGLGSNKFDPNNDIADLSGKVYVVTGGSSGIGFGIVAHLLQHNPERIILLGKKEEVRIIRSTLQKDPLISSIAHQRSRRSSAEMGRRLTNQVHPDRA